VSAIDSESDDRRHGNAGMNVIDALLGDIQSNVSTLVDSATNSLLVVAEMELRKYCVLVGHADHCALREILHQIVIERTIVAIKGSVMGESHDETQ
jgi:hypothetical protein